MSKLLSISMLILSLSSSVATAIIGFPSNISFFFQNISCTGNENVGEPCRFLDVTDPQCIDISANRTAGVRCTESELLASRVNIICYAPAHAKNQPSNILHWPRGIIIACGLIWLINICCIVCG